MTAKIKLNAASGGGSFSLQAPSSSSNNRVMTLPDTADGTVLTTTNPKAGNIIQVKQTVKKNVFSTSISSNTNSGDTGLNVSITPSSNSNKILISTQVVLAMNNQDTMGLNLFNGSSLVTDAQGDADGSRGRAAVVGLSEESGGMAQVLSFTYLHSPASTSEQTYGIRLIYFSGSSITMYMNRVQSDDNASYRPRSASFITAMEVAA